jgi:hypothetical protein
MSATVLLRFDRFESVSACVLVTNTMSSTDYTQQEVEARGHMHTPDPDWYLPATHHVQLASATRPTPV